MQVSHDKMSTQLWDAVQKNRRRRSSQGRYAITLLVALIHLLFIHSLVNKKSIGLFFEGTYLSDPTVLIGPLLQNIDQSHTWTFAEPLREA